MDQVKNLETLTFQVIKSYAEHLNISEEYLYSVFNNETLLDDFIKKIGRGEEMNCDISLFLHASIAAAYAHEHAIGLSPSTEDLIGWASAYGFLCGKLEIKTAASARGLPGSIARAEKYDNTRLAVIERMKKIDSYESMSAADIATALFGLIKIERKNQDSKDMPFDSIRKTVLAHRNSVK